VKKLKATDLLRQEHQGGAKTLDLQKDKPPEVKEMERKER